MDNLDKEFEDKFKSWLSQNASPEFLTSPENINIAVKSATFGFQVAFGLMYERMEKAAESKNLGEFIKVIGTVMNKPTPTQPEKDKGE